MEDLSAWFNNLGADVLEDSLADDVVVEHVTTGRRILGKEAVLGWLNELQQRSAEDHIDIVKSSIDGSTIWTERVDHHLIDGQWHDIPVMGVIELNADQQVVLMRDYFDPRLAL
ncbi:MAG: limonene-1,2-epoxide hydrolase family protein [Mycobacterium sp.]